MTDPKTDIKPLSILKKSEIAQKADTAEARERSGSTSGHNQDCIRHFRHLSRRYKLGAGRYPRGTSRV